MSGAENSPSSRDSKKNAYNDEMQYYMKYLAKDTAQSGQKEELQTTPLFSLSVKCAVEDTYSTSGLKSSASDEDTATDKAAGFFRQFGLLGFRIRDHQQMDDPEPIFMNTDAPNSTFICGSQGSGKSYTLACMLENCLLRENCPGSLPKPVAGVVFHYDLDSSMSGAEAARLCSQGIQVRVLVSRSNKKVLEDAYMKLEGAKERIKVESLLLKPSELTAETMLRLMSYSDQEGHVPLYMAVVQRILREMAIECGGKHFKYEKFKTLLDRSGLTPAQQNLLGIRLGLLESFLDLTTGARSAKSALSVEAGALTVIDLSDPFVDASTVCLLFDICLTLLKKNRPPSGLVGALDEAHKYMGTSEATTVFTERLLTTIREQRHNAIRVIIATQEPTISEKLMELSSVTIVHRFTSPIWFTAIKNHLGAASTLITTSEVQSTMFENIMNLKVGQSMLFSPASFLCLHENEYPKRLGHEMIKMKTRVRSSTDGGQSELASGGRDIQDVEVEKDTVEKAD